MRTYRILGVVSAAALSLLLASGCGGGDDTTATPETGTTPSATATPSATGPGAAPVPIVKGEIPKDLPKDIPTFPEAKPETSVLIPGRGGLVTFSTGSSVAEIASFYTTALEGQGWKIDNVSKAELRTRITASKDGRQTDVVAARNGDTTEILISLREAEAG